MIKSGSYPNDLIQKFKARQQQKRIEQALVYLKLKDFNCPTKSALIFAKKQMFIQPRKERNVDGTMKTDGPANYRKLQSIKPEGQMQNGWLKGEKLKYQSTTSFNDYIRHSQASILTGINKVNQTCRQVQQQQRKIRSQSLLRMDLTNPKTTLQKISAIKDNVMKERQQQPFVFKLKGMELPQMTRIFAQDLVKIDTNGLVVKTGAFHTCINDKQVEYVSLDDSALNKSMKNYHNSSENIMIQKRNQILNFKRNMDQLSKDSIGVRIPSQQQNAPGKQKPKSFSKFSDKGKSLRSIKSSSGVRKEKQIKQFDKKVNTLIRRDHFNRISSQGMKEIALINQTKNDLKL